jgi:hypothetical protein
MKLNQLAYICQLLERQKIPATQLCVKGKNTSRVSFTLPVRYGNRLTKVCAQYNLKLSTSIDIFLPSIDIFLPQTQARYHIELPTRGLSA